MLLQAGVRLAGFEILAPLGAGGMGEVYRALDLKLGREVAIKTLPSSVTNDENDHKRFEREAKVLASLNHPNIAAIYGFEEAEGIPFLIMELVPGRTLAEIIREGPLEHEELYAIFAQLASGLEYAHEMGVVHRDFKPLNIKVSSGGKVKILDFGLATALRGPELQAGSRKRAILESDDLTEAGMLLGTPGYMSPEQTTGADVDKRADIWAFGCVLFEALAGARPFQGRHHGELFAAIRFNDLNLGLLPAETPKVIIELLDRCLQKRARDRLRDAGEARIVFERLLAGSSPGMNPTVMVRGQQQIESGFRVVLFTRMADSHDLTPRLGVKAASDILRRHDELFRECVRRHQGRVLDSSLVGHCAVFNLATGALLCALEYLLELRAANSQSELHACVGIHAGEFGPPPAEGEPNGKPDSGSQIVDTALRLMTLALPNQILLSRIAFDTARQTSVINSPDSPIEWLAHGLYEVAGEEAPLEIFEVGAPEVCALRPPPDGRAGRRILMPGEEETLGWRPSIGRSIPGRDNWRLVEPIGSGGFGEVWLAKQEKSGTQRVFKFCFDPERVRALKREVVLFRVIKESLGDRKDIAQIIDWEFERPPFYIESEFSDGGNLVQWVDSQGGIGAIGLDQRLELVSQVAVALGAAHSTGVLHKDVKPANILISRGATPMQVSALLADFGIGAVTNRDILRDKGITHSTTMLATTADGLLAGSAGSGTRLYMAPEVIEGKPPSTFSDIYALGIVLYQIAIGDFKRALAPGWEREIDDEFLRDDIAACVDRVPERRLANAGDLAQRLRTREERRATREAERLAIARAEQARRRKRRTAILGSTVAVGALVLGFVAVRERGLRKAAEREKIRADAEAARATTVKDFLVDLFQATDPLFGDAGRDVTALDLLAAGREKAEKNLATDPENSAVLLYTIGLTYYNLGRYDESLNLMEHAIEVLRDYPTGNERAIIDAMDTRVDLLARTNPRGPEVDNAIYDMMQTAIEAEKSFPAAVPRTQRIHAFLLGLRGENKEAVNLADQALMRAENLYGENHLETVTYLSSLGNAHRQNKNFEAAKQTYQRAISILEGELGPGNVRVGEQLYALGLVLEANDEVSKARDAFRRSLDIRLATQGPGHVRTTRTLRAYARNCKSEKDFESIELLLLNLVETAKQKVGESNIKELLSIHELQKQLYVSWNNAAKIEEINNQIAALGK